MKHYCNLCTNHTIYDLSSAWPRDTMYCTYCGSSVRERALVYVLNLFYPNIKNLKLHESSPSNGALTNYFNNNTDYSFSHYFKDTPNGELNKDNIRCVDLNNIPFEDNEFDIFVTLDVFEHLFHPETVIKEIYRVLKPGGCYIMTVPIENFEIPTEKACDIDANGEIYHIQTTKSKEKNIGLEYHGNPIDNSGSVVTYYYGYDIIKLIKDNTNFDVQLFFKKDDLVNYGICGYFKDVIICLKR
jgi:SAM-dependent methyltransferase